MSVKAAEGTEAEAILQRLLGLRDDAERRLLVTQYPSIEWSTIVDTLAEQVWQEVRVDPPRAQALAEAAISIAEAIGNPLSLGKSYRAKANALYATDQHAAAIQAHQRAAHEFEKARDQSELARSLSGSTQPLLLLGRYDEALAAGDRARAIFTQAGNLHRLARLEINIGNIYHRQDRFAEALACYEHAFPQLLDHDDAEGLAAVLSNLALCYISVNEFAKALDMYSKARRQCADKNMPLLVAYADYNIAYLYFLRGEYGRAIKMLRDASLSARKAPDVYQLALCNLDLAEIYLELNLSAEAGDLAQAAHEAFQQLGFGYEAAKALAFGAIAASRQGQAFEGIKLFAQAKDLFTRDHNLVWPSLIDLYQALVFFNEGRLFEARRLCSAAYDFFRESALRGKAVLAGLLLSRIALRMNDQTAAQQYCQSALEELIDLDSPVLLYQGEFLMGQIQRATGNDDHAYQSYQRAREAIEKLRGSIRGEELKIAFFENKFELYENLVDICLRRPQGSEEAFTYIEQAKSRSLVDVLSQPLHVAVESDTGQSALVRSIRNLREELNWYYNLIEREQLRPEDRSQEKIGNLEQQARARELDLKKALQEATLAEAGEAGVQIPTSVSIDQIRAALPADTALVEYFCVQERDLACVLTRDSLQICPVTVRSRVRKLLQLLQFQLSKFRLDPEYVSRFTDSLLESTQAHLKSLYEELVAPIRPLLTARNLVFIPHGLLHYVPFHALHDGEGYLVDSFAISYAPSASIFALCQSMNVNTAGDSLILGVPDTQAPAIDSEVQALKSILPNARAFVGNDANEEVLRTYGPGSSRVHIATHGYFRQDNPMFSSIRLGTSHLSLYDLCHLRLPAELVVLSGCATGLNVVTPGDELIGLVRGLLQAGAQSLLLSLWDVHDESTRDFMIGFYTRLQQGARKAVAVQETMAELRMHYPHPYYWAPFTLIGKG
jgi:CHAT domain-containing protein